MNIIDLEAWICCGCLHMVLIDPARAYTLFDRGCEKCQSHEFALHDLLRELECC